MASTGKPMAAGLTLAMGKMAPFLIMRSTRLRTVGSETPMARAMLAYERRAFGRSSRMMRRSSSSISMRPKGRLPRSDHDRRSASARYSTSNGAIIAVSSA